MDEQVSTSMEQTRKRSRAFAITSLSLGLLSVSQFAIAGHRFILVTLGLVAITSAILGIIFGILQLTRRRSARGLAYSGIALSVVALGVAPPRIYEILIYQTAYIDYLEDKGYGRTVIDNPITVERFRAVEQSSAVVIFGAFTSFGWYNDREEEVLHKITYALGPNEPSSFDPADLSFGYFIKVDDELGGYKRYTESAKNEGESHVKVYPTMLDGRVVPHSYLLFWEGQPLDVEPSYLLDFTDLVVRVHGVTPVLPIAEE